MFYNLAKPTKFDGKSTYIDLTKDSYRFKGKVLSIDIKFKSTEIYKYMTFISMYYKFRRQPDFYINIERGYLTIGTMQNGRNISFSSEVACCNGQEHFVQFRGCEKGILVYLDGVLVCDEAFSSYCEDEYNEDVTIGRGITQDEFDNYFDGEILEFKIWDTYEPVQELTNKNDDKLKTIDLFYKGLGGCENYRIPLITTTKSGVTIATVDARYDAVGDNPNHIMRGVRTSSDSGETWSDIQLTHDYGGVGIYDGAAAMDGSLLYDDETDTVWMIFCHTPNGIGNVASEAGSGYDRLGRKILFAKDGEKFFVEEDYRVVDAKGADTGYSIDIYNRLYKDGECCGSVCHGIDRKFTILNTSFLQIIKSTDNGKTWTDPFDLNPTLKKEWMRFLGAGPSNGIKIKHGKYKGRLVFSLYFSSVDSLRLSSPVAMYSDDKGETWTLGDSVNHDREFDGRVLNQRFLDDTRASMGESKIFEIEDGKLRIFIRNQVFKTTAYADSYDGGQTWTNVNPTEDLIDPICQTNVLRVERDGKVYHLFSNPEKDNKRVNGTVKVSVDNTKTWIAKRRIDPGEFSYSCMTELPDGQIGLLYEGKQLTQKFVKFPLEWILSGNK